MYNLVYTRYGLVYTRYGLVCTVDSRYNGQLGRQQTVHYIANPLCRERDYPMGTEGEKCDQVSRSFCDDRTAVQHYITCISHACAGHAKGLANPLHKLHHHCISTYHRLCHIMCLGVFWPHWPPQIHRIPWRLQPRSDRYIANPIYKSGISKTFPR